MFGCTENVPRVGDMLKECTKSVWCTTRILMLRKVDFRRSGTLAEGDSCHCKDKKAASVNPVDAKVVIGDKFPETWIPFLARFLAGKKVKPRAAES